MSVGGRPRGWHGRHRPALGAGAMRVAVVEPLENGRELRLDVGELEKLLIELVMAVLAVPLQSILFACDTTAFNDESHGVGKPLRGMRHIRWQQEHLAFADGDV